MAQHRSIPDNSVRTGLRKGDMNFVSDNLAGASAPVLQAMLAANDGLAAAYGNDAWTKRVEALFAELFEREVAVFLVTSGTAANALALASLVQPWGAVLCHHEAHVAADECGAPEFFAGGAKIVGLPGEGCKLAPEVVTDQLARMRPASLHQVQPQMLSITQATECGLVYTPDEIRAVASHAHDLGLRVHVDGARLANAAAALGVPLRALTTDVGVDVVSLGGTKNGLLFAEAVVVLQPDAAPGMTYLRKMDMQLASKMRFLSAQLVALFEGDLWLRSAAHANAMAARLAEGLTGAGVELLHPAQANGVFAHLTPAVADELRRTWKFYDWAHGTVRLMCAFDTTEQDVDDFLAATREALTAHV